MRVVRAHAPGVVLAATDFSDTSLPAVEAGRAEADRLGVGFLILHAVEVRVLALEAPDSVSSRMMTRLLESEIESSKSRLEQLRKQYAADDTILSVGSPAEAILEEAARLRASWIIVGTHGRSGFQRLTLGSVAESVLRRAPCSMLIVRLGTVR
ncbi:MAG: universal stress protein [Candidatus Eisenbacteria bacterium]|nr:universal stress protein [Candidatus Eisenbacteria bacterium]